MTPWQQRATTVVLVLSFMVLAVVLYVAAESRSQGDVIARVDEALANQEASAESERCVREITAAGEVAQLESLDDLAVAFLDLVPDNEVNPSTVVEVQALRVKIREAVDRYERINDLCPVAGMGDGDPNNG